MKNVEMKLEGDILTIKVDVTKEFGPSASGITSPCAPSAPCAPSGGGHAKKEGNISIPDKDNVKIGLNVYRKK